MRGGLRPISGRSRTTAAETEMTEKEVFHGMTPEKAFNKYTEWYKPRGDDIEVVKLHPIEPKLGPGPTGYPRTLTR